MTAPANLDPTKERRARVYRVRSEVGLVWVDVRTRLKLTTNDGQFFFRLAFRSSYGDKVAASCFSLKSRDCNQQVRRVLRTQERDHSTAENSNVDVDAGYN